MYFARDASLLGLDYDVDERPTERRAIEVLDGRPYDHAWKTEHIDAVHEEANRWVPLFQMDSSFTIGLNMWDAYTFVVQDLLAGRFDCTHAQLARR